MSDIPIIGERRPKLYEWEAFDMSEAALIPGGAPDKAYRATAPDGFRLEVFILDPVTDPSTQIHREANGIASGMMLVCVHPDHDEETEDGAVAPTPGRFATFLELADAVNQLGLEGGFYQTPPLRCDPSAELPAMTNFLCLQQLILAAALPGTPAGRRLQMAGGRALQADAN